VAAVHGARAPGPSCYTLRDPSSHVAVAERNALPYAHALSVHAVADGDDLDTALDFTEAEPFAEAVADADPLPNF
jgi:hypothetical protein